MPRSILITGGSGYLGGSLLANLRTSNLPTHDKIYALVRNDSQAEAVLQYGVEPLHLDLTDEQNVIQAIVDAKISIIFFLIDALTDTYQISMIKALAEVKKQIQQDVHFLHTSGAKIFSSHAGHPIDNPIKDDDPNLFALQKASKAPFGFMTQAVKTNLNIIEFAEAQGVRSYIFIPCIVYGKGEGFGNIISIQTVAIVKAAKQLQRVYDVNEGDSRWPVCHISDNSALYIALLKSMLLGKDLDFGKNGYYLASSGEVVWADLYAAMAKSLEKHQVVHDAVVRKADDAALKEMALALGCEKPIVAVQLGGRCSLEAHHGRLADWRPQYSPTHILESADAEVQLILDNLK